MSEPTEAPPLVTTKDRLPWQIRAARLAEGLFLPVGVLSVMAIPLNDYVSLALVFGQVLLAAAAFVGLGRRRRWAWILAMALAIFLLVGMISRAPALAEEAIRVRGALVVSVAIVGWAFLTQLAVLANCLALLPGGRWRTELR